MNEEETKPKIILYLSHPMLNTSYELYQKEIRNIALRLIKNKFFVIIPTTYRDIIETKEERDLIQKNTIVILKQCNALFLCKDWERSKNCKRELDMAKLLNKEIIYEQE